MKKLFVIICLALSIILTFTSCLSEIQSESGTKKDYIVVEEEEIVLWVGDKTEIKVASSIKANDLIWESSDPRVADIYYGKLTAARRGEATITVKDETGKVFDSVLVTVKQHMLGFSLSENQTELGVDNSMKIKVSFTPAEADDTDITFESSDETVATVDSEGVVLGKKEGTVVITAKSESKDMTKTLTMRIVDAAEYDICNSIIRTFLSSDRATSYTIMSDYCDTEFKDNIYYDGQNLKLTWTSDGSSVYNVKISENKDYETYKEFYTSKCEIKKGTFVPGKAYYIRVTGDKGVIIDQKLKIKKQPVRMIDIDGVANVRDLGGWRTSEGKTVKYGMLLRGAELEGANGSSATATGRRTIKDELGVKTEIDLRLSSEKAGFTENSVGFDNYLWKPFYPYSWIIPENASDKLYGEQYQSMSANYLKDIFNCLANENNYPVYFHCVWGADRTGTLAFLINGLLGVSYEDLAKDFELTSFSHSGKRSAIIDKNDLSRSIDHTLYTVEQLKEMNSSNLYRLYWQLMTYYGTESGTLSDAIENYLISVCKVSKTNLDSIKALLIEDSNE